MEAEALANRKGADLLIAFDGLFSKKRSEDMDQEAETDLYSRQHQMKYIYYHR